MTAVQRGSDMPGDLLLSERLRDLLAGSFFRPLGRPSAPIYVDCADRLAQSADEGGQLSHEDALALIRDVLALHPRAELSEDEGGQFSDLRQRAGQLFNKMIEAGWLQDRPVSLDERWVLLAPRLRPLLRLLRELAESDVAELKDFAATLRSICATLLAEGALDPDRLSPEDFRQTVKELLDRVGRATDQMHAVETIILRHEQEQRVSGSASETLNRFLVEFHAGEHMVCYDALQRGGLLPKLNQARVTVQDALASPFARDRLAQGLAAHRGLPPAEADAQAERMLQQLDRGLGGIRTKAQIIDSRIADFSRLSALRHRYQTELRGRRPEQTKTFLEASDRLHAGKSFADLATEPGMPLLSAEVAIYFGRESLSRPRRVRPAVDLTLAASPPARDSLSAQDIIRKGNLNILTPQRAGRFVEERLPAKGARLSTADFSLATEDDLFDLLAVLAFERATGVQSHRPLRWRIHSARSEHGLEPERIVSDKQADHQIERFTIERTA